MPAELVTWQQKPSMYAESFRVAISSILFGNDYRGRPKVIIVTSPGASEGKTTVAANMAIAMAEAHRRVVLIDLDFRGPRLHKVFGLPNDTGVSDVLADVKPVADYNIDEMVRATHVPGLVLMAAGTSTDNIMGLLCSGRIRQLVERLRMHFDTVIIDTAPLLPFPEPRIVARVSDGVILVFRSELTNRSTALAALERLREDGSIVLGTILNDCSFAESENAYYHYANL